MHRGVRISAVIPCYNEEAGVAVVLRRMPSLVDEVVVVANACTDRTEEIARQMGARVIVEPRPGYGRAYKTGLAAATHEVIVTMDGDGTYPTIAIGYLIDVLVEDKLDFISAWRIPLDWVKNRDHIQRFMGNKVLTWTIRLLYFRNIQDSQSGMWVFRKNILDQLNVTSDGMPFSEELKIEVYKQPHLKSREVAVQFKFVERIGSSKLNLWDDGLRNLVFLFKKRLFPGRKAATEEAPAPPPAQAAEAASQ